MRGHLEPRGKGTWRVKVFLGRDPTTGRRRYLNRTVHGTKRQAELVLNELLVEAGRGAISMENGTFSDLAARWIEMAEGSLSPTTLREYERLLARIILPRIGAKKVGAIRAADLDAFYADLQKKGAAGGGPLAALSIQHVHALVRRLLNQAVRWGWIVVNPATKTSPPRVVKREMQLPSSEAVLEVIAVAAERDPELACFLRLAAVTGARRGEVCGVHWQDVDLDGGVVRISRSVVGGRNDELIEKDTKTHASRRVTLDDATIVMLQRHRTTMDERAAAFGVVVISGGYVFSDSADGTAPWRPGRVTLAFGRLARTVGIPGVRLHDLRHFAATQLLAAGVPVRTVAGRLGHANAATTLNVYAQAIESSDAIAATVIGGILSPAKPTDE